MRPSADTWSAPKPVPVPVNNRSKDWRITGPPLPAPYFPHEPVHAVPGSKDQLRRVGDGVGAVRDRHSVPSLFRLPSTSYTAPPLTAADLRPMVLGPTASVDIDLALTC